MTYGKIGPDGGIVPTIDRDGQTVEAAKELGHIDWRTYVKGGVWNDTHDEAVIVGLPSTLEFHDGTTPLSKAHGKLGFWTTGRLFNRTDPSSWSGLTDGNGNARTPTPHELDRADHFWKLASMLKGIPRPLGLSAHGRMALSECRTRIVYAEVDAAAVCELPVNPDATLEPMAMAVKGTPLEILRKGMITRGRCGRCTCPEGACLRLLKAVHAGNAATRAVVPEDLEGATDDGKLVATTAGERLSQLVQAVQSQFKVDKATARRWVREYLDRKQTESTDVAA